jgi:tRNA modification GTPase
MYEIDDTIAAVSSPSTGIGAVARSIIRVSGPQTLEILKEIFQPEGEITKCGIVKGKIPVDDELEIEATVYVFFGPASYTGEDLVELHVFAAEVVVQHILGKLFAEARLAGPGEFTLRAYLNGRMDLSQAEAVAQVVAGSNELQLEAAQKLLAGKLCDATGAIRRELLNIMSLIEAGLDFAGQDIEFVTVQKAVETISAIRSRLDGLLAGSIRYEEEIDLPAVGLAGAPNAGKSSLLNALLGKERSIVSQQRATTRDVLTGVLQLDKCNCALFDCAGLLPGDNQAGILDTLAREAATEALNGAQLVLLCVDADKDDYAEDIAVGSCLQPKQLIYVATKCDLLGAEQLNQKATELNKLFGAQFTNTSALTGDGLANLRELIDRAVVKSRAGAPEAADRIAITERHRRVVLEAMKNLTDAGRQVNAGNDEVAAMLLRAAYDQLGGLEREDVDEAVLERIFSHFCIGK